MHNAETSVTSVNRRKRLIRGPPVLARKCARKGNDVGRPLPVPGAITDVFKALSDPMRWNIVCQMAGVDELACTTLERTLPITKPTISYHIKVLYHAGLVEVRKEGRYYFYRLRRDVLDQMLPEISGRLGAGPDALADAEVAGAR
jgi:DNA-binding transcriptional ArsR family regulator